MGGSLPSQGYLDTHVSEGNKSGSISLFQEDASYSMSNLNPGIMGELICFEEDSFLYGLEVLQSSESVQKKEDNKILLQRGKE